MIIGSYVRQVLEDNNKVILPGFGALKFGEAESATEAEGGKLTPPGKKILFDQRYTKDDGILAGAIVRGERIAPEEARQRVLELVDAIRFSLDKGEEHDLHGAGIFSRDGDGKVHFLAEAGWTLEPDQFGLEPMDLLELDEDEGESEKAVSEKAEAEEAPTAAQETVEEAEEKKEKKEEKLEEKLPVTAPVRTTPPVPPVRKEERPDKKRSWRALWIVAAVLVVLLAVLLLLPADIAHQIGDKLPFGKDRQEVVDQQRSDEAQTGQEAGDEENTDETEETSEVEELDPETAAGQESGLDISSEPGNAYYIIAGSFTNIQNASDLQDYLIAEGFKPEIMITENRLYRVSVASFVTKQEALDSIWGIRSHKGLEGVWLLSN